MHTLSPSYREPGRPDKATATRDVFNMGLLDADTLPEPTPEQQLYDLCRGILDVHGNRSLLASRRRTMAPDVKKGAGTLALRREDAETFVFRRTDTDVLNGFIIKSAIAGEVAIIVPTVDNDASPTEENDSTDNHQLVKESAKLLTDYKARLDREKAHRDAVPNNFRRAKSLGRFAASADYWGLWNSIWIRGPYYTYTDRSSGQVKAARTKKRAEEKAQKGVVSLIEQEKITNSIQPTKKKHILWPRIAMLGLVVTLATGNGDQLQEVPASIEASIEDAAKSTYSYVFNTDEPAEVDTTINTDQAGGK